MTPACVALLWGGADPVMVVSVMVPPNTRDAAPRHPTRARLRRPVGELRRGELAQFCGDQLAHRPVPKESARALIAGAEAARDAAQEAAEREREATVETRRELEQVRADARADRQALQTQHAEQLRQLTEAADARAAALSSALDVARGAAETYRAQLANATASPPPASPETHSSSQPGRRAQKP